MQAVRGQTVTSADLAAKLGEGWAAAPYAYPATAKRGFCTVTVSRIKGYHADFKSVTAAGNAYGHTPQEAVRACLRGVYQRVRVTLEDLEAVLPGVTK